MQAAKVREKRMIDDGHTELRIDLGADALISKKWYAALIDEHGHPIMGWVHLDWVARWDSGITVPINHYEIKRESARVALVEELPQ
jgi:hypothetical protein